MGKLQTVSIVVSVISIIGFVLWRFVFPFPDWLVRVNGILMLAAIFTAVFSTVKITGGKQSLKSN